MSFRFALLLLILSSVVMAQTPAPAPPAASSQAPPAAAQPASAAAANPADVDSIDHIMAAVYDVISGPAGQPRDWNRFRSLFLPEARLIPNGVRADGAATHTVLSVEDYVTRASRGFSQQGFFESESSRRQERFGNIAHIFSTYESRREKGGQPFARGINSFQLLNDGHRWFVVTIMWQAESASTPIPPEYLKKGVN